MSKSSAIERRMKRAEWILPRPNSNSNLRERSMIFFWRGRGFVVSLFTIVSLILLNLVADAIGGDGYYAAHVFPKLMAFLLAAAGVFLVARGDDGSHFFFIPLKAWPFIIAILDRKSTRLNYSHI